MATVLYLTISPDREPRDDRLGRPSAARSAPPPATDAAFLACTRAHRSASRATAVRRHRTHRSHAGSTLACFTDGLYERRTEPIDGQLERLRASRHADHPERVCSDVMGSMVGSHLVEDDTALLVLTRTQPPDGPTEPPDGSSA